MRGNLIAMYQTIVAVSALCGIVQSSVLHGAPINAAPVVASSSQYFERTFNRLVVPPVIPVAAPPPVFPVAPSPPVIVEPARVPVAPVNQNPPVQPSVAVAVATAHAAAPIATILLPPYPFGLPPGFGFVQPINVPDEETSKEVTTPVPSPKPSVEPEPSTAAPSNIDNTFIQPLPSNNNVNFRQYGAPPQPTPQSPSQNLKTSVEVVPVPLAYIAPPPLAHHHHHHGHHVHPVKIIRHVHTYVPRTRVIIRPALMPLRIRKVKTPVRSAPYTAPLQARKDFPRPITNNQPLRPTNAINSRDVEPSTFRPFKPNPKPPKL